LNEHRAKLSADVVQEIEKDVQELRDAISQNNYDRMRDATTKVKNGAMKIGQAMYSQAQGQQQQQQDQQQQQQQQEGQDNQQNK
jgi:hypothetical protein